MQVDVDADFICEFLKNKMYELHNNVEKMRLGKPYFRWEEDDKERIRESTERSLELIATIRTMLRRVEPELIRRQKEIQNCLPTDEGQS